MKPKFDDCETCIYFLKRVRNPVCRECDSGEFFTERVVIREKNQNELMKIYEDMHHDQSEE